MREHMGLYRGKHGSQWIEGFYMCLGNKYHYILAGKIDLTQGYPDLIKFPVDPDTVGECTGLTDKNGKLIFEGDIVREYNILGEPYHSGAVCWSDLFTGWRYDYYKGMFGDSISQYEIIGNIHDNPELLKDGEG